MRWSHRRHLLHSSNALLHNVRVQQRVHRRVQSVSTLQNIHILLTCVVDLLPCFYSFTVLYTLEVHAEIRRENTVTSPAPTSPINFAAGQPEIHQVILADGSDLVQKDKGSSVVGVYAHSDEVVHHASV